MPLWVTTVTARVEQEVEVEADTEEEARRYAVDSLFPGTHGRSMSGTRVTVSALLDIEAGPLREVGQDDGRYERGCV